ncbi:MAG: hypothetical protein ACNA8K_08595 [Cyclonatronaceae bacterium]
MLKKYLIPSLFYLIVTLVTGCWIRLQWADPSMMVFNPKFLIHSHSHVAMLGWLFLALAGLIARYGMTESGRRQMGNPVYLALLHFSIGGMTIAFALQGYAFYSILLSTLFILLSLWFAIIYFRHENPDVCSLTRNFLNAAVFWMVFSSVGPLALAGGTMMGPDWIRAWVAFYLHLQFNGWITFALIGLIIAFLDKNNISINRRSGTVAFWLLFAGLLPSIEPMVREFTDSKVLLYAGIAGSFAVFAGSLVIGAKLFKRSGDRIRHQKALFFTAVIALLFKSLFHAFASLPGIGEGLIATRYFAIGFVHLLLLGFASMAVIWLITVPAISSPRNNLISYGTWIFVSGAISMILLLFAFGMYQYLLVPIFLPVQWILLGTGLVTLSGGCIILYNLIHKSSFPENPS